MPDGPATEPRPPIDELAEVFDVYETRRQDGRVLYFGQPRAPRETVLRQAWPLFRDRGYQVTLTQRTGEDVLVAEPIETSVDGFPWTNVVLFVATLLSTLYVGTMWYYIQDPLANPLSMLRAWPFAAGVMGVFAVHEFGHYAMSRYHDVEATLPYFIPMPTLIGTMGAFIRLKGRMPDRKALFDIGVAGPLAGLVATVVVTAIGLSMDPITAPDWVTSSANTVEVQFGKPPLFLAIAAAMGVEATYHNPVVLGGWVGMFVTFLNLIPVGQLDGGHIVRALIGDRQQTIAAIVPGALFALAGYLYYVNGSGNAVGIWVLWGIIALFFATVGPAQPIDDRDLDPRRKAIGLLTLLLGLACFAPVPIQILA
jgi:membrane-associated protease RseP (regulator of RpoE activity)